MARAVQPHDRLHNPVASCYRILGWATLGFTLAAVLISLLIIPLHILQIFGPGVTLADIFMSALFSFPDSLCLLIPGGLAALALFAFAQSAEHRMAVEQNLQSAAQEMERLEICFHGLIPRKPPSPHAQLQPTRRHPD